jgi:hypothetical protein
VSRADPFLFWCRKVLPGERKDEMVRKQISIEERHELLIQRISKAPGVRKILPE